VFLPTVAASACDSTTGEVCPPADSTGGVTAQGGDAAPSVQILGGLDLIQEDKGVKRRTNGGNDDPDETPRGTVVEPRIPDSTYSDSIWFNDTATYRNLPSPFTDYTFDSLYTNSGTSAKKASSSFAYGGNGVPVPVAQGASEPFVVRMNVAVNKFIDRETISYGKTITDPRTGEITYRPGVPRVWETMSTEYRVSADTVASPVVIPKNCLSYAEYRLDGALQKDRTPMKSVKEGGTLTRTPEGTEVNQLQMLSARLPHHKNQ
jgi:hypothetical protein